MGFRCGLVGLPNVGKSTLFNSLTRGTASTANYPFTTIEANVGVAPVEDLRLDALAEVTPHESVTPTALHLVDIAGLVKNASQGEGLGNQFLSEILQVDAIAHVIRCFEDEEVVHVTTDLDPVRDAQIVELEILLKDLEWIDRWLEKHRKVARTTDRSLAPVVECAEALREALGRGQSARAHRESAEELRKAGLPLASAKPVFYIANVDEDHLGRPSAAAKALEEYAAGQGAAVVKVSAKVEQELQDLEGADRQEMMQALGLEQSALQQVVRRGYELLELVSFFTTDSGKIRAWTVADGTRAAAAAGRIHTDFEKGFVRAEVGSWKELVECGADAAAQRAKMRTEGRDYVVRDGDVIHFKVAV
ncbi:MAG: redox-regulated ATPase YchF [Candidatus Omnitrophica bacterium]|nr:redox-regulated ATPase YchF [Candidatus Omnitrophota bacterium]